MRIVVNDIAASTTGALSVLKDFYRCVVTFDHENEWIFLLGDRYVEETENIHVHILSEVKKSWFSRLKFDYLTGSTYIHALNPDVVFSLQNTLTRGYQGKQVVYVHQPLGFQKAKKFSFFKSSEREYAVYQYMIGRMINHSIKHADKTIVQTDWMRDAIIQKTHVKDERVVKILPDIEPALVSRPVGELQTNQFFFPSGNIIYKNHSCILQAAALLCERGIEDFNIDFTLTEEEIAEIYKTVRKQNRSSRDSMKLCHERVTCRGRLSREEVQALYYEKILIFPSYIETFGYPPAEAREAGTIIFASNCPFCHEILDGYADAYYFDPFDPVALAELMEKAVRGEITKSNERNISVSNDSCTAKSSIGKTSWTHVMNEVLSTADCRR